MEEKLDRMFGGVVATGNYACSPSETGFAGNAMNLGTPGGSGVFIDVPSPDQNEYENNSPAGKYYLVDAGYPLQRGYLKPFSDTRYHIPDFARASNVTRGRKEMFNKRHSSLRGVIERTFGVWKKKWVILRDMPQYKFSKQVQIVIATMTLHNYIRRHHSRSDINFHLVEEDEEYVPAEAYEYRLGQSLTEEEIEASTTYTVDGEGASEMAELRERITDEIVGV